MLRDWNEVKKDCEGLSFHRGYRYLMEAIAEIEQLRQEKATLEQISDGLADLVLALFHKDIVKAEESMARIREVLTGPEGGEPNAKP